MTGNLLFCYGSLQQGFSRHWIIQSEIIRGSAYFMGRFQTRSRHPLILRPPNFVPALLDLPDQGEHVQGELYFLRDETMNFIRKHGSYGRGLYFAKDVQVEPIHDAQSGSAFTALTFFLAPKKCSPQLTTPSASNPFLIRYDKPYVLF
jgi:gamma-glutamylcyclotransferase (GGCT)/AIG2-like uncharacterized protein YtfP